MRQQPAGEDLLICARYVLRDEILPALPDDRKHALRMVLNAISIAQRQLHYGSAPELEELLHIRTLLDDQACSLNDGLRQVARIIRSGGGDPGQRNRAALISLLRSTSQRRLNESNPNVLAARPS
ncbi:MULTISPECIES: DUF6285 domain-containing protein [unclassified Pseudomonas]|uniref:DUF6285 domain-containing protein n=1 Tax=unclassified Pseudomonas TaxID=196821 RepID=UPI001616156C|nr:MULTISPECIES: DUF6285 domain-containing protein [unclassified Pseudomonas]MBB6290529.1 hypothetical protein [Pseudomonas sp. SJZ073]MBB6315744.1 hypothetical protein [Pseudomonas sp. JAI120]